MIPVVDLDADRRGLLEPSPAAVAAIRAACETSGFFVATGHGVPQEVVDELHEWARAFFALPHEVKAQVQSSADTGFRGWQFSETESLAASLGEATPPDMKEGYAVPHPTPWRNMSPDGVDAGDPPDVWPRQLPELRDAVFAYYAEMEHLARRIMAIFALALDLPVDHFEPSIDRHISGMRLLHYPTIDADPVPGQLRAGAHTDYGSVTILSLGDDAGGLQVRADDGTWIEVPRAEQAFVINLGDLMAQWTNDRWRSTLHRVVNPADAERARSRQSIAFFHQPNADAVIEPLPSCCGPDDPPRYEPVTSLEHREAKLAKQRLATT